GRWRLRRRDDGYAPRASRRSSGDRQDEKYSGGRRQVRGGSRSHRGLLANARDRPRHPPRLRRSAIHRSEPPAVLVARQLGWSCRAYLAPTAWTGKQLGRAVTAPPSCFSTFCGNGLDIVSTSVYRRGIGKRCAESVAVRSSARSNSGGLTQLPV